MRILIADDVSGALVLLERAIKRWGGYDVIAANDGEAAWNILRGPHPPQLALLDWMASMSAAKCAVAPICKVFTWSSSLGTKGGSRG